jgi:hypothetical protein
MQIQDVNPTYTPTELKPLAHDADSPLPIESWLFSSIVGMMMYLAFNSQPEIAYAVHQCAGSLMHLDVVMNRC